MSKYGAWDSSPTQPLLDNCDVEETDQAQTLNEEAADANSSASLRAQGKPKRIMTDYIVSYLQCEGSCLKFLINQIYHYYGPFYIFLLS